MFDDFADDGDTHDPADGADHDHHPGPGGHDRHHVPRFGAAGSCYTCGGSGVRWWNGVSYPCDRCGGSGIGVE